MEQLAQVTDLRAYDAVVLLTDHESSLWPTMGDQAASSNGESIALASGAEDHLPEITIALGTPADVATARQTWADPVADALPLRITQGILDVHDTQFVTRHELEVANGNYRVAVFRQGQDDLESLLERGLVDETTTGIERWLVLLQQP